MIAFSPGFRHEMQLRRSFCDKGYFSRLDDSKEICLIPEDTKCLKWVLPMAAYSFWKRLQKRLFLPYFGSYCSQAAWSNAASISSLLQVKISYVNFAMKCYCIPDSQYAVVFSCTNFKILAWRKRWLYFWSGKNSPSLRCAWFENLFSWWRAWLANALAQSASKFLQNFRLYSKRAWFWYTALSDHYRRNDSVKPQRYLNMGSRRAVMDFPFREVSSLSKSARSRARFRK